MGDDDRPCKRTGIKKHQLQNMVMLGQQGSLPERSYLVTALGQFCFTMMHEAGTAIIKPKTHVDMQPTR